MTLFDQRVTRRRFISGAATVAAGAAAVACAPPGTTSGGEKPSVPQTNKELKILTWNHFIPQFDQWFDPWVKDWATKENITVSIDHINIADLPARFAAEVAAQAGHDLIQMIAQPATYLFEHSLVDVGDVVSYAESKHGPLDSASNKIGKVNGVWRGWPNFFIDQPLMMRRDLVRQVGEDPDAIKGYDDVLRVGKKLKGIGKPGGIAISHCNDSNHNLRSIMWSFGASEVGSDGTTITADSSQMRDFLSFMQEFYHTALYEDVFAWQDVSDNQWLDSGNGGFIHDAISALNSVRGQLVGGVDIFGQVKTYPPMVSKAHPNGLDMPDYCAMGIWKWSPNQNNAKKFMRYYIDNYLLTYQQSRDYNSPTHYKLFDKGIYSDKSVGGEFLDVDKFGPLAKWKGDNIATWGYPGPPTAQANQFLAQYVLPDTVQQAVRGTTKTEVDNAIKFCVTQMKSISGFKS
jgi:multiple sugar transport system substrate-binding protein